MTSIKIDNLPPAGTDLFSDPESFMTDLSESEFDQELGIVKGGLLANTIIITTYAHPHPTSIRTSLITRTTHLALSEPHLEVDVKKLI